MFCSPSGARTILVDVLADYLLLCLSIFLPLSISLSLYSLEARRLFVSGSRVYLLSVEVADRPFRGWLEIFGLVNGD